MRKLFALLAVAITFVVPQQALAADRFISTTGSDANDCLTQATACLTANRGYQSAAPGDTVRLMTGAFSSQVINEDFAKAGQTTDVTFAPAAGATPTLAGLVVGNPGVNGPHDLTFHTLNVVGSVSTLGRGEKDITFTNSVTRSVNVAGTDGFRYEGGRIEGGSNVFVTIGFPLGGGPAIRPRNVFFDTDFKNLTSTNGCLHLNSYDGITVEQSSFSGCVNSSIRFDDTFSVSGPGGAALIENNVMSPASGAGAKSIDWEKSGNDTLIRYNSTRQDMEFPPSSQGRPFSNFRLVGNVAPIGTCETGVTYRYNIIEAGPACGVGDQNVADPMLGTFFNPLPGSPALDAGDPTNYPPFDYHGGIRYDGSPDAGAVDTDAIG